ncbi:MAG: Gfo/Idh/MocA family oxidoreductase, partial [Planctomycetes bacterium]|nr:Gfo/Idh/MocA family oxidoreductase [Planctomycetota bacterium]
MSQEIKVGFIGTGGIAGRQARTLDEIEGVDVVAGADPVEEAREKFAADHDVAQMFSEYEEMLELEELDAVSVCTPNFLHHAPTVAALKSGNDVIVEKPMAMNADEAQEMVETATEADQKLVIGFQFRLSPQAQMLKRYLDEGEIGQPLFGRVQALRRRGIPNWGVFGRKELQGGGPLIDIGVHMMEMAHYLMGRPRPVAASASTYTYLGDKPSDVESRWAGWDYKTYTVEDLATGYIRFENGACMAVESSFAAHIEGTTMNVQIMGEKGGCTYAPPKIFKDEAGTMVNVEPAYVGNYNAFDRKMEN